MFNNNGRYVHLWLLERHHKGSDSTMMCFDVCYYGQNLKFVYNKAQC